MKLIEIVCGLDSRGLGTATMVISCKRVNEPSGSIKHEEFLII